MTPKLTLSLAGILVLGALGCDPPKAEDPLRTSLAAHRAQQIEHLHAYALAGQFPHNVTSPNDLHIFRDADGRYCAVANLIRQDGREDLVETTVRDRNDLAIKDVHDGPMMEWIRQSGLTQEELERIQFPSRPFRVELEPRPTPAPRPTPVEEIALRPPRPTITALDEDALKTLVRAHLAEVEAELRAGTVASLDLAVLRTRALPPVRFAAR